MGGPWTIRTDNPLITGAVRSSSLSIAYGEKGALTYCYRLWCFDFDKTDLF